MLVKIIDYDHLGRGIAKVENKVIFISKKNLAFFSYIIHTRSRWR